MSHTQLPWPALGHGAGGALAAPLEPRPALGLCPGTATHGTAKRVPNCPAARGNARDSSGCSKAAKHRNGCLDFQLLSTGVVKESSSKKIRIKTFLKMKCRCLRDGRLSWVTQGELHGDETSPPLPLLLLPVLFLFLMELIGILHSCPQEK